MPEFSDAYSNTLGDAQAKLLNADYVTHLAEPGLRIDAQNLDGRLLNGVFVLVISWADDGRRAVKDWPGIGTRNIRNWYAIRFNFRCTSR